MHCYGRAPAEKFRSEKILIDKLMEKVRNGNIKLELNHVLDEVLGDDTGVNGMRIRSVQDESTKTLPLRAYSSQSATNRTRIFFRDNWK